MRKATLFRVLLAGLAGLLCAGLASGVSAGGNVWTGNEPEDGTTNALALDPAAPATLYAGIEGGGVFGIEQVSYRTYLPLAFKTAARPELYVLRGPDLRVSRSRHTATCLTDGRILLVGGEQATDIFLTDVDIFDPVTGSTSQAAPLHRERAGHTATLLPDGRVLVVGGGSSQWGWMNDAEVYDPVRDTWTVVSPHYSHGLTHTATLMRDGRVLVVGGNTGSWLFTERVKIFDPQTNTWTEAQPLPGARANHTAELLPDGRVLVAGGSDGPNTQIGGDVLLYDPQSDTWTATGPMVKPRIWAQSVQLHDGRVLVAGGMALEDMPTNTFTSSVEIYDPASNTWSAAPPLSQPRYAFSLELLPNGQVLAVGGARDWECCWGAESFDRTIEVYNPVTNQWRAVANLPQPRAYPAVARLSDGRIWLSGGRTDSTFMSDTWWLVDAQTAARLSLR